MEENRTRKSMLLHSCCGPCSTAVITRLIPDYRITLFFYNPNITDAGEYGLRRDEQRRFLEEFSREKGVSIAFLEGDSHAEIFFDAVQGLEEEPEGGRRCEACFSLRLTETAAQAAAGGYDCFDTTLSVSPHKDYDAIVRIGQNLARAYSVPFAGGNYKKKNGFAESVTLSERYGLYRQSYCGCDFSRRDR